MSITPFTRIVLSQTDSTNKDAWRHALDGAPDRTLIVAKKQTQGRGRRGREWIGGDGNLFWSLIIRPHAPHPPIQTLSLVSGLAVRHTIDHCLVHLSHPAITIKWPNDVLVGRKKIAGILVESSADRTALTSLASAHTHHRPNPSASDFFSDDHRPNPPANNPFVVIGIGINIAQAPNLTINHPGSRAATALADYGANLSVKTLEDVLNERINRLLIEWQNTDWSEKPNRFLQDIDDFLYGQNLPATWHPGASRPKINGTISGLDDQGYLRLDDGVTMHTISYGDIIPDETA